MVAPLATISGIAEEGTVTGADSSEYGAIPPVRGLVTLPVHRTDLALSPATVGRSRA